MQRYALLLMAIFAFVGGSIRGPVGLSICEVLVTISAIAGVVSAGRHV